MMNAHLRNFLRFLLAIAAAGIAALVLLCLAFSFVSRG